MHGKRTHRWYTMRVLLAVGIGAVPFAGGMSLIIDPAYNYSTSTISAPRVWEGPLGVAAFLGILVGLAWMLCIARGPRVEPAPWRYRDR